MTYNTAIIPGSIDQQSPEAVAAALHSLVGDNLTEEAHEVFKRYNNMEPKNQYLVSVYADVLIEAGRLAEAERLLEGDINKQGERFSVLMCLGQIDEARGQNLNAFDLYQRCEQLAGSVEEKQQAETMVRQVKNKIKSEVFFKSDAYLVVLEGNQKPLKMQYNINSLKKRKDLLDAIINEIDPRSKSVIEIESDAGIIARNLSGHGFKADGTATEMSDVLLAIGYDYVERLRKSDSSTPEYFNYNFNSQRASVLDKRDVILILPKSRQWYEQRGAQVAAELIGTLAGRAKRQLFFNIPPEPDNLAECELVRSVLGYLKKDSNLPSGPELCYEDSKSGRLYRVNQSQAGAGNRQKLLPFAPATQSTRSAILEVEVDKCRSLNGFSFTEGGWNHFTALLKDLLSDPKLTYEKSALKTFYDKYQPKNRQEQFFGPSGPGNYLEPLDRGWTLLPWAETKNRTVNPVKSPTLASGGNPHYGPNSNEFGINQAQRLLATYTLIKEHGYLPEIFPDGYIQGYLLKDGSDYRFYVNEGQHRMAAIGLLGYSTIKVKFNPDFIPVVDIKNIKDWPQVRRGLYSEEMARRVFCYYFEEDGRRKANELELFS